MNKKRMMRAIVCLMVMIMTFVYTPEVMAAKKDKNVQSVKITNVSGKTITLEKGKAKTLKVKVNAKKGKKVSQKVTFKSSKSKVAKVTAKGKITAKSVGTAKITVTSKENTSKKATLTVKVVKPVVKVSKITLNQTSASLMKGQKVTLVATVAPTNAANKAVTWVSSNPAVASVANGVVTAVSGGTATVSAVAQDGSGVKATATIVVRNPIVVNTVTVENNTTVKVQLSEAQALTAANFTVKINHTGRGGYRKDAPIDSITTTDNKTYFITLHFDLDTFLEDLESVQVTVTGLYGTPSSSKTAIYNEGVFHYTDEILYGIVYNERLEIIEEFEGYGYSSYTISGLPAGVGAERHRNGIRFYGRPQQTGKVISTLKTTDELGNTYTYTITWLIDSPTEIAAGAFTRYVGLDETGRCTVGVQVHARGCSGDYAYAISGTNYGLTIDKDGWISGELLAAGVYNLKVAVADKENVAISTTTNVVINVSKMVTISGIIKDLAGNPIPNAVVMFINDNKAAQIKTEGWTVCDENGMYVVSLIAGTYDILATNQNDDVYKFLYNQPLSISRSGYDITLPVQRIVLYSNLATVKPEEFGEWYDQKGNKYGNGNILWLEKGNYTLTSTNIVDNRLIDATVNINVTTATTSAVATVTERNLNID